MAFMTNEQIGVYGPNTHPYPYSKGVRCQMCRDEAEQRPASHKVEEQTEDPRHPLTAYVCCEHFAMIMGNTAARMCEAAGTR